MKVTINPTRFTYKDLNPYDVFTFTSSARTIHIKLDDNSYLTFGISGIQKNEHTTTATLSSTPVQKLIINHIEVTITNDN